MIGRTVGNYKITGTLGEGGVGMVYKAVDTMLDREVAIKVLRPELASQTSIVERFRSEAVTLAKLSHPNIATLYSLLRQGDDLFMVLEFIQGETLDRMLYQRGPLPVYEAIPFFCQALEGIDYAHERGVVHRDIKPGNLMVTENGILKVLDFGIARLLGSDRATRTGNIIGTLEYMSPEQVRGLEADPRSDVYGLGILLYEILTGRLPFESENDFELMKMQTEMEPMAPRSLNPKIPPDLEAAILKALAKNADERFPNAGDFLDVLLQIAPGSDTDLGFTGIYKARRNTRPSDPGSQNDGRPHVSDNRVQRSIEEEVGTEDVSILGSTTAVSATLEVGDEIKKGRCETRQEPSAVDSSVAPAPKGTRIADSISTSPEEFPGGAGEADIKQLLSRFYQRLCGLFNYVGYRTTGAVLVLLLALATLSALPFLLIGGQNSLDAPKNVGQESSGQREAISGRNTEVRPATNAEPTPQPNLRQDPPVEPQTPAGGSANNDPIRRPAQDPLHPEREMKSKEPPSTRQEKPNKSAPVSRPPKQKNEKSRDRRLRDLMTGN